MERAIAALRSGARHLNLVALSEGSSKGELFSHEVERKGWALPEEDAVGVRAEAAAHEFPVSAIGAAAVAQHIRLSTALTQLTLHGEGERSIGEEGVIALCKALEVNSSITSFTICSLALPPAAVDAIAAALRQHPSLLELRLERNSLTGDACRVLAPAVASGRLRRLELSGNDIGGAGAEVLATALRSGNCVEDLTLDGAGIDAVGAQALALLLLKRPQVQHLAARRNRCGDAGAGSLAAGLRTNTGLVSLDIAMNGVSDAGCAALCDACCGHPQLRTLGLRGNRIHDAGAAAAARLLRATTVLVSLDLDLNFVSEEGVTELAEAAAAAAPQLRHVDVGGNSFATADCPAWGSLQSALRARAQEDDLPTQP